MIKLLNAGFTRLRKNKLFWILAIFSIGLALLMIYSRYSDMKNFGDTVEVEQLIFNYSTSIGIVIAIFTSLFLGVEYSDGVIRNKVSIGHKRTNIYLSNLIITSITSLFSYILFMLIIIALGIPLFGKITLSISSFIMLISCILIMIISTSSIFTFIAMFALTNMNTLQAPKFIETASITNQETNEFEMKQEPNPKYPSETKKKVCQILLDINPAGQGFQIADGYIANTKVLPLYSLGIIVVFTGAGLVLFKKKELK